MSTMVLEVSPEQEKALEGLLKYMDVAYQTISPKGDFWNELSPYTKERIQKGLDDARCRKIFAFSRCN
ncbi:MAG: hypothetical protein U5M51_15890 [Emticicia sp.]|nr:hypothetical protein [Emticicia sp.]